MTSGEYGGGIDLRAAALTGGHARLTPHVLRIVAPNPSALTGPGTNTYVLRGENTVVIDPALDDTLHLERVLAAADGRIDAILCTHSHPDHSPGATVLSRRTGAPVFGRPAPDDGYQDDTYHPDEIIADGTCWMTAGDRLIALHTPGHASNHVCFLLEGTGMLFTGDHLMSGSTVVILPPDGSMRLYLQSLQRLLALPIATLAPGHGAVIEQAHDEIKRVLAHRLKREDKLINALRRRPGALLDELLPEVYADVPPVLHEWARFSLLAHALKLLEEGTARRDGDAWWWDGD